MVTKLNAKSFEEALYMTGFGKFNCLMMLINISLILAMAFEVASVAYLVPASACELKTTNFQQGLMAGIPLMGIIATSHFWGYLADTRGRRKILIVCMSLGFMAGSLSALSTNWIMFSVFKFLSSCAVSGTYALALTLLSECTPQHRRSIMVALTGTIYLCSTGIMAVITIPILHLDMAYEVPYLNIEFVPWRLLTLVFAIPCSFAAFAVYLAFESPRFLLRIGEEERALKILKSIFSINTGKSGDDFNVDSLVFDEESGKVVKGMWASLAAQTVPLLKPPLLKNTLLLGVLFTIVYFALNSMLVWLPFIADAIMKSIENGDDNLTICQMIRRVQNTTIDGDNLDCSLNEFGMISVFVITTTIASINTVLSTFINKLGRKRLLIGTQLISGVAGMCVNVSTMWTVSGASIIIFLAGVLNFGFLSTFSVDIFPTYVKAMAVCLTLMVGRGSSVLGISILKNMFVSNCELAFYLFGGLAVVGGIIGFLLPNDVKMVDKFSKDPKEQT